METVRQHLFNDRIWPDFTESVRDAVPLVQFMPLEPGTTSKVLDYEVTTTPLVHAVPSQGYLVRRGAKSVIVCGDTYGNDGIWAFVDATPDLAAIVLECSFPSRYDGLAKASLHLTPRLLAEELKKLSKRVPVLITHIKPEDATEVVRELAALGDPRVRVLKQGETIDF